MMMKIDFFGKRFFVLSLILFLSIQFQLYSKNPQDISLPDIPKEAKEKSIVKLKNDIDKILSDKGLAKTDFGVAIYSIDENEYFYQKHIDKALTPASTTKLFTAFSALYTLGADFEIKTSIYFSGTRNGEVLNGDLYLFGRGDVLLSVSDINMLVDRIYAKGIRKLNGNIYADASYFDVMTNRKEYSNDRDLVEPLPPITALSIEKNTATIFVTAGKSANEPLHVSVVPKSESLIINNQAIVKGGKGKSYNRKIYEDIIIKCLPEMTYDIDRVGDAPPEPKRRRKKTLSIYTSISKSGNQTFTIKGYLNPNKSYSYRYFINNPPLAAAGALKNALISHGISVSGDIEEKKKSELKKKPDLLVEFGRPVMDLIQIANKESDNFIAENLFKIVGAYAGEYDDNGSRTRDIQKMIFDSIGINFNNCLLNDGSGLSRRNLVTPRALIGILVKAQYLPFDEHLYNSLSIAGYDGTLHKRMKHTVAENNLCAKTGTLRNASALTGYVSTMDGELLAFAFMFNGPYVYNYKVTEDKIGVLLAGFSYSE